MIFANTRGAHRGIASIEFALTLPILILLVSFPVFLSYLCWHYTAMQRAASDAARFLSKAPVTEIVSPAYASKIVGVANQIVKEELSDFSSSTYYAVGIQCDAMPCAGVLTPTTVTVSVQMLIYNPFPALNTLSVPLVTVATYPYLGR